YGRRTGAVVPELRSSPRTREFIFCPLSSVLCPLFLAGVEGLEPPTPGFGDRCSSQLSYTPSSDDGGQMTEDGRNRSSFLSVLRPPSSVVRYSMICATTPAPTVRPPSRIANRSFSS